MEKVMIHNFARYTVSMVALVAIQIGFAFLIYPDGHMFFLGAAFVAALWAVNAPNHVRSIKNVRSLERALTNAGQIDRR